MKTDKRKLSYLLNPINTFIDIYRHKDLLKQLAKQNIQLRYKGSGLGCSWSFITPLFLLMIYIFVFGAVFKAKFGVEGGDSRVGFALVLFCGLATYNIFSESVNNSSTIILSSVNYVKKVVFPLELLPVNMVLSAFFFGMIWFVILFLGIVFFLHKICFTAVCLPLILLPLIFFTLGVSWLVASFGVYIRDTVYLVGLGLQILLFMTPIFYPLQMVPERYQKILSMNPLTPIVETTRGVMLYDLWPDWQMLGVAFLVSLIVFQFGYAWFMKTKRGFADVI